MTATPPPPYSAPNGAAGASGDNKAAGARSEKDDNTITVMVIGETANGKSTLIRQLGVYSGNPSIDIDIGYGNVSCTKVIKDHHIATTLHSHYLKDNSGKRIKNVDYSTQVDYTEDDATLAANPPDDDGKNIYFKFVDTPGLDDSDGNDMEIMANIIGKAGDLSHLNAIIYVRKFGRPFGNSFSQFYDYMQRCMPLLCDGIVVVHSGFSIYEIEAAYAQKCDLLKERKQAFEKATKRNIEFAHFFMDNDPDQQSPFAVKESYNSCYNLLKLLAYRERLETKTLKLLKTPNMINTDAHVALALEQLQSRLKKQWEDAVRASKREKSQALRAKAEISRLNGNIDTYQSELKEMDNNDTVVLGTKTVSESYGLKRLLIDVEFWLEEKDVTFDSDYPITLVHKTTSGDSEWHSEDLRGTAWRAKISAGAFRSINGTATFYTTNRQKHKREIDMLRMSIKREKESISFHEGSLAAGPELDEDGGDGRAIELGERVESCSKVIRKVKSETFDVLLWPLLKRFYTAHHVPSKGDIVEFTRVYDPSVADSIFTVF